MHFANPFTAPGNWYKGNLHTHTTVSDGVLDPEECVRQYRAADYDFLALTDHGIVTPPPAVKGDDFLVLLGVEMDGDRSDIGESFHVLAFGLEGVGAAPPKPTVPEAIQWTKDRGGEALIAHPSWSGLVVQDLMRDTGHLGIEIFNSGCHYEQGKGYSIAHWDDVLGRDRRMWGFAVDDSHHHQRPRHPRDTAKAWVMVKAPELTREALLQSLRDGLFYSSFGPTIHDISIDGDTVTAHTSPASQINCIAQRWAGAKTWAMTTPTITAASYQLTGREQYLRIECRDIEGRWAWSNPMFLSLSLST
jgi:hypothetical protein